MILRVLLQKIKTCLAHASLPWVLALLAVLLCLPALWLGRLLDDDIHRLSLQRPELPMLARTPAELFVFIRGDEDYNRSAIETGLLPWWANENLRLAFFRPVTGYLHWLDYEYWHDSPLLMHLHSLLWLAGVVFLAAVFYRRLFGATWIAGLAALLFTVDESHGLPAVWLANRNALIGMFFGLTALIAHDRWRRSGGWWAALIAPLAFLVGLLSKESTVAVGACLLAYAIFLDPGKARVRFCSLLPCAIVGLAWLIFYQDQGYGAAGSAWYIDPRTAPGQFLDALALRAPLLMIWQWIVPANLGWELTPQSARVLWWVALGMLALLLFAMLPLLKRNALARFWLSGMVLSLIPVCSTYPAPRLLCFAGIGGMGLLAQFLASVLVKSGGLPKRLVCRVPIYGLCGLLLMIHLGLAPWYLNRTADSFKGMGRALEHAASGLPSGLTARFQTGMLINTPGYATWAYGALSRMIKGDQLPVRFMVLGTGGTPLEVCRPDDRTLVIRPEGGFFAMPGPVPPNGEMAQLLFDHKAGFPSLDRL
ncbi:MAG: hypothetical protein KJ645_13320, partial [Planctomycetes bacterium]|nr:hypothetical protein [Planctomycetota bacterium]